MGELDDWNRRIIEEFRANGGKVGGRFEGAEDKGCRERSVPDGFRTGPP